MLLRSSPESIDSGANDELTVFVARLVLAQVRLRCFLALRNQAIQAQKQIEEEPEGAFHFARLNCKAPMNNWFWPREPMKQRTGKQLVELLQGRLNLLLCRKFDSFV